MVPIVANGYAASTGHTGDIHHRVKDPNIRSRRYLLLLMIRLMFHDLDLYTTSAKEVMFSSVSIKLPSVMIMC